MVKPLIGLNSQYTMLIWLKKLEWNFMRIRTQRYGLKILIFLQVACFTQENDFRYYKGGQELWNLNL